jgi:hypothetical protein
VCKRHPTQTPNTNIRNTITMCELPSSCLQGSHNTTFQERTFSVGLVGDTIHAGFYTHPLLHLHPYSVQLLCIHRHISVTQQTFQDSESLFPEMSPSRTQFLFTLRWDIPIHAYYLKVILYSVTRKVLSTFIFCRVFSCESTAAKAKSTALNLVTAADAEPLLGTVCAVMKSSESIFYLLCMKIKYFYFVVLFFFDEGKRFNCCHEVAKQC